MKTIKKLLIAAFLLIAVNAMPQIPQAFNYQAVARDASGNVLSSQLISLRITILDGSSSGTVVYTETQMANTNQFGIFTLALGKGSVQFGAFSSINWASGSKFLKVEMDASGGTSFVTMGTTELLSVPYAMYANSSGTSGNTGPMGPVGATGPTGITGSNGTNGATGATGPTGSGMGPTGPSGATGTAGAAGATGPSGAKGATGATGMAGINGTNGSDGANGADGATGPAGADGATGPSGVDGATGGYPQHFIGESYGGGIVYYVTDDGQHGLIASTTDQTPSKWYGGSFTITRARADGYGAGLKNTLIMIADQAAVDGNPFSATVCNEYNTSDGYGAAIGDWYLPSVWELYWLYVEKDIVGGFDTGYYWSSTEYDLGEAWAQDFNDGTQFHYTKDGSGFIRAIRAF
jgi:hypothetical protein